MGSTLTVDNIVGATTAANVKMPAGAVLQVIQAHTTTETAINSGERAYSDVAGVTAAITPKYSDSKVLVRIMVSYYHNGQSDSGALRILRGSTVVYDDIHNIGYTGNSDQSGGVTTFEYLDSPSTTSATTYGIYLRCATAGQACVNKSHRDSNESGYDMRTASSITAMEIAG